MRGLIKIDTLVLIVLVGPILEHVVGLIGGRGGQQVGRARGRVLDRVYLVGGELELVGQVEPVEGRLPLAVVQIVGQQAQIEFRAWLREHGDGRVRHVVEHVGAARAQIARRAQTECARAVQKRELYASLDSSALLLLVVLDGLLVVGRQLDVECADGRRAYVGLGGGRVLGVLEEDEAARGRRLVDVFDFDAERQSILVERHEIHAELLACSYKTKIIKLISFHYIRFSFVCIKLCDTIC